MLKENERLYSNVLILFDVLLSLLAFVLAYYIRIFTVAKSFIYQQQYLTLGIFIVLVWYILSKIINLKNFRTVKAYSIIFIEYFIMIIVGISILFVFIFVFKLENISRLFVLIFGITNFLLLFLSKIFLYKIIKYKFLKGKNLKNIIIIADNASIKFIDKIINDRYRGYKIFSIISVSPKIKEKYSEKYLILNKISVVNKIIEENTIDEIIYCKGEIVIDEIRNLIYSCAEVGVNIQIQSEFISLIASKSHINYFDEIPVMSFKTTSSDYMALAAKRIIDYLISFFAVIFFSPFLILISIIIKIESKGAVLFKQKRVGLRGRIFTMYKFRTMVNNAEELKQKLIEKNEADGPVFKIKKDPRLTRFGSFLRKISMDEFPQFFNVLLGDMAIVGPRPPINEEVKQYKRNQLRRLSMKPGITCIWQVSGRNEISFEEWIKMDLQYIDNWSLKYDIILIMKTINAVFRRTGY